MWLLLGKTKIKADLLLVCVTWWETIIFKFESSSQLFNWLWKRSLEKLHFHPFWQHFWCRNRLVSDRTRIFWFGRTEPEPEPKAPNPNRTRTEPHSSKMGTFWHKNYFHPSNTKIGSKKPSNLAKELWENARGFIVSEAMKNKFQPIFAFFSNSKVENCWYYGILVRLWFGWPNQLVR